MDWFAAVADSSGFSPREDQGERKRALQSCSACLKIFTVLMILTATAATGLVKLVLGIRGWGKASPAGQGIAITDALVGTRE